MIRTRETIAFTVHGIPIPKMGELPLRNAATLRETQLATWINRIGWTARAVMAGRPAIEGPVRAILEVVMPNRNPVDSCCMWSSVLDGIRQIIILNDDQVANLKITRSVNAHDPCVRITIEPIQEGFQ